MRNIQKTGEEGIPLIRELTFQVWPQTYAGILSPQQIGYMLEMMYSPGSLQQQMAEGAQFIILYEENTPVGFASYQQLEQAIYKLHKIYVLPSQQGKGSGKYIIEWIEAEIRPLGAQFLQLQVNKYNKARSFYEKLGFTVVKAIVIDIGEGYFMDDYLMQKAL